jgi:antitoxin component YwqK of YwqJK toxin-antitoxin module
MSNQIKKATLSEIHYKQYPEFMFAMIAAYLPKREGHDLRRVAGKVVFRHVDTDGNTYKNGVLHSYNDEPAIVNGQRSEWYKDGKLHRDGDLPAIISTDRQQWCRNGSFHRDGDLPAVIGEGNLQYWYKYGKLHREGDLPAVIHGNYKGFYKNGVPLYKDNMTKFFV